MIAKVYLYGNGTVLLEDENGKSAGMAKPVIEYLQKLADENKLSVKAVITIPYNSQPIPLNKWLNFTESK